MIRAMVVVAGAAVLSWSGHTLAQAAPKADVAKGKQIAGQICAACHGPDGNSIAPVNPSIAGQFPEYLYKQLRDFKPQGNKKPARANAIMAGMVASLSDADMRDVAAYYAGQTLRPATASDKDLAELGQKIYRGGNLQSGVAACSGCHGPTGVGIPKQYPRVAGQFAGYIEAQLAAFKAGTRENDAGGMMRGVAAKMTDKEIKAVAQYAAGLR